MVFEATFFQYRPKILGHKRPKSMERPERGKRSYVICAKNRSWIFSEGKLFVAKQKYEKN